MNEIIVLHSKRDTPYDASRAYIYEELLQAGNEKKEAKKMMYVLQTSDPFEPLYPWELPDPFEPIDPQEPLDPWENEWGDE